MVPFSNSLLILLLILLLPPLLPTQVSSFLRPAQPPSSHEMEEMSEDKTRIGSAPPSCHNRCNGCHPCMAIQVPTLPSHDRVSAESIRSPPGPGRVFDASSGSSGVNQYSNYKPMGWKCHCDGHLYNP
ncbi:PREDICTED: EPIDERMAL PATTERNING FACTOR-like protein 1 [Tarenaya hassleriana]|uniref:EPIDERMAL PATTERNING FACTOR-like protein 1 n=1 Tax=Tarenaya hassleriana TaxID=28532 RepID=UPI00053C57DF|nr:PREDICTED: EPIDERMAL PATTERNING FACTOR-like protein 1 [Tarenaya hassleriana]